MSAKSLNLSDDELAAMFEGEWGRQFPPVMSPKAFAAALGLSLRTVYEWLAKGRLDGSCRRRGKHVLIIRDRAFKQTFNDKDWNT
jgi:excisionase family DNA binding protein